MAHLSRIPSSGPTTQALHQGGLVHRRDGFVSLSLQPIPTGGVIVRSVDDRVLDRGVIVSWDNYFRTTSAVL